MFLGLALMFTAAACSVPVFRWALERWPADPYELLVFHEQSLSGAEDAQLRTLEQRARDEHANLEVREIDLTRPIDDPHAVAWKQAQGGPLPGCVLLYPPGAHVSGQVWSGALSELPLESLLDSPARRELARRILGGQSGVWLFLGSGDQAKDGAAKQLLTAQIDHANQTLHLPDMTGDEVLEGPDAPDISNLRVEFSLLDVRRDDPAEAMLVRMLLGTEPDLAGYQEAMAFPVYGRGRVLYALIGQGINARTVMKANAFLVGECACEIKAENPGTDLLMPVDWEKGIGDNTLIGAVELPPLPGTALPAPVGSLATVKQGPNADTGNRVAPLMRNAALVAVAAGLLVVAITLFRLARGRSGG
jgi:hypothetical protein